MYVLNTRFHLMKWQSVCVFMTFQKLNLSLSADGGVLQIKTPNGFVFRVGLNTEHMQALSLKASCDTHFDKDELAAVERCFETKVSTVLSRASTATCTS